MTADTFFCDDGRRGGVEKQDPACAQDGYDGLLVSHGGVDLHGNFFSGITAGYPDRPNSDL